MSRPSGRLQLAPAGHVRSIVNSASASVRACVRDARNSLVFQARRTGSGLPEMRCAGTRGRCFEAVKQPSTWGPKPPYPRHGANDFA